MAEERLQLDKAADFRRRIEEMDKLDPKVLIRLKGQDFYLEFNNFTVKEFMKATGINIIADGLPKETFNSPQEIGELLYHGLRQNHPELDQDQVDRLFTYRHFIYVTERLKLALQVFMPDMSDWEKPEAVPDETIKDPT